MNDKQKWFIVVAVVCITALGMAFIEGSDFDEVFDILRHNENNGVTSHWTGTLLFGVLCSSITGFFLFKDK